MTVSFTNSGAGLFDRVGAIMGGLLDMIALEGGTATARTLSGAKWTTRTSTLLADFALAVANKQTADGLYKVLAGIQSAQSGAKTALKSLAQNTLIDMVNADTPLATKSVAAAMAILIQQMVTGSQSVNASTVSVGAQTALGTVVGDPAVVVSLKRPDGRNAEYAFPETLRVTCTNDKYLGATEDREPFLVTSPVAVSDTLAYNWPGGSGVSVSLTAVDAAQNASAGQLLTNGAFENFTTNTPDNWTVLVGTPGTDIIAAGSSDAYNSSSHALEFKENSATLPSIAQTLTTLKPNTVYLVNFFAKKDSGLTGNGTIQVSLIDGSNALLTDDQGTSVAFTQTAAGLATTYGKVSGVLITPKNLPTTVKLRVRMSVAIADSGKAVYIDNLAMTAGTELYTGGPYAAVFAGATAPVKNDTWTVAIANDNPAMQATFERLFGMRALGLQLPSDAAAGETLADSLVA